MENETRRLSVKLALTSVKRRSTALIEIEESRALLTLATANFLWNLAREEERLRRKNLCAYSAEVVTVLAEQRLIVNRWCREC